MLSGFVISHVYLERVARRTIRPSEFFVLRFSRLYPLHVLTLGVVAALQGFRSFRGLDPFVYDANDLLHLVLNLAFVQYGVVRTDYSFNAPSWSLTIEEISYLAFFVSLFFFARRFRLAFVGLLLAGVILNRSGWDTHLLNLDVSRGLVGFFAGCLAYQAHRFAGERQWSGWLAVAAATCLGAVVLYYVRAPYALVAWTLLVHSLVIFPAMVLLVLNAPWLTAVFSLRPLSYLGEISYSVYMIHFPVQLLLATVDELAGVGFRTDSVSFFALYAAVTLGLSAASYHGFEKRVQAALRARLLG